MLTAYLYHLYPIGNQFLIYYTFMFDILVFDLFFLNLKFLMFGLFL